MSDKDDTQMEGQLTIEFLDYARFDKCIRSKCLTHSQVGDFVVIEKSDGDNYTEAIFAVAESSAVLRPAFTDRRRYFIYG